MVHFDSFVSLIIVLGVLQVCTTNPIAPGEEKDVTKMVTADELQRARSAGIKDREVVNGITLGVRVDEMIKLLHFVKNEPTVFGDDNDTMPLPLTFKDTIKLCDVFVPEHKTATNYSKVQEARLNELWIAMDEFPRNIQFLFIRNSLCAYASDPSQLDKCAENFGSNILPFMRFRFWVLKSLNGTDVERVDAIKQVCCAYKGDYNKKITEMTVETTSSSLPKDQMIKFDKLIAEFRTANTPQSFEQVCHFLRTANPSDKC